MFLFLANVSRASLAPSPYTPPLSPLLSLSLQQIYLSQRVLFVARLSLLRTSSFSFLSDLPVKGGSLQNYMKRLLRHVSLSRVATSLVLTDECGYFLFLTSLSEKTKSRARRSPNRWPAFSDATCRRRGDVGISAPSLLLNQQSITGCSCSHVFQACQQESRKESPQGR